MHRLSQLSWGLLTALLLTGAAQAATPDSVRTAPARQPTTTLIIGGLAGTSRQYYDFSSYARPSVDQPGTYRQRYQMAAVGVARTWPILKHSVLTLELQAAVGNTRFSEATIEATTSPLYAFSPYLEISQPRYFRFGLGADLGNVGYDFVYRPMDLGRTRPKVLLEAGSLSRLYLHLSYGHNMLGLGNGTGILGLGSGFGNERQRLVLGAAMVNSEVNAGLLTRTTSSFIPVVQAQVWVGPNWLLEPHLASNFENVHQLRLQARYRLPDRTR
ncbi:hypothetical protein [Hymenobacter cellulosivorans]|uniref:Outer membrane protein beta-barrel domain-containing protein n=1 Tax=Hymenobacter cellulosivorans TaxID=2932249 RepID=A0ABY4F3U3_9BACT|nr:hypothetical protein [Hymenobacter cellulosivorans]UOQ50832.1 hypothetical protein MUN80_13800 [Hymenobacter cellulosivorans]